MSALEPAALLDKLFEDIGRFARDVPHVVRIMRAGHVVNIDAADASIQMGDKLITVRPSTAANGASNQL